MIKISKTQYLNIYFLKYLHSFYSNLSTFTKKNVKSISDEELLVRESCLIVYIYHKKTFTHLIINNLLEGKCIYLKV